MRGTKKGFTLVELIVVIGLVALFGAIVLSVSLSSSKLFSMVQKTSRITDDARIVIGDLEDELRFATNIQETNLGVTSTIDYNGNSYSIPLSGGNVVIVYTVKEGDQEAIYSYVRNNLNNEVTKYKLASSPIVPVGITANNVTEFEIKKDSSNKIYNLNMTIDDGKNRASYKSAITPRN